MLSAMTASTGGMGMVRRPRVESARVIEWAIVNPDGYEKLAVDACDDHQAEHEQEVVDALEDVLNAQDGVGF